MPIAHRSRADQIVAARGVIQRSLDAPQIGPGDPVLATLATETEALHQIELELAAMRAALAARIAQRDTQHERFKRACRRFVAHVDALAEGDPTFVLSTGLELQRPPSASIPPVRPMVELAAPGLKPGELDLRWGVVPGATGYLVERTDDELGNTGFVAVATCTARSVLLTRQPTNIAIASLLPLHPAHRPSSVDVGAQARPRRRRR